jgi:hypothetical protein
MINDWKDFVFIIYIVFFGAYALDSPVEFILSSPIILLAYVGVFAMDRKTLYILPAKDDEELQQFVELCTEINEFDEMKVLEMRVSCEKEK